MGQDAGIRTLKGIGEKSAALFARLGVETVGDLAGYFPRTYEKPPRRRPVSACREGEAAAVQVVFCGGFATRHVKNLSISNVTAEDESGQIGVTFFNMPYLKQSLKRGEPYVLRGTVKRSGNRLVMEQPRVYRPADYDRMEDRLCPRYGLTQGLTNQAVEKAAARALEAGAPWEDFLPDAVRETYGLAAYETALRGIHFPEDEAQLTASRGRLVFDEFLLFLLQLGVLRSQVRALPNRHPMIPVADTERLIEALPYRLTGAQQRAWQEIQRDLGGETVMNRLIQGDVGSGKTILAILALLQCAANGCQGALMAPTEVLARQHYEQIRELTRKHGLAFVPVLLTGSVTASARRELYRQIETGEANLIVGTHALIQEAVTYRNLGLVVTDEQHRFGVRQRELLAGKGEGTHVLVMSATPIPRTLAMILYGDLDISVIRELPQGRLPIRSCVIPRQERPKAYRFLQKEIAAGHQAYVICPMVEEGDLEEVENVTTYTETLRKQFPAPIQTACLHGRMKPAEKNRIMEAFAAGSIDILVSTTVVEVGVNVPNATVILIENAERFGLAQLHQLRGRVGRGNAQSYCIFVSGSAREETLSRLQILCRTNDGFEIAEEDLKLRGPGDLFGLRQSGILDFRLGDIFQDAALLSQAGECAAACLREPERFSPVWKYLEEKQKGKVDFPSL